ncbi:MAG: D-3-phosphoglycerate dehydrogenase [Candidatus Latescibacteria bacterium ADurb.Bin168]|nr:MAG: D-3-phosphoglycerate dehydrogenase [Candidatus Latescibacteria bacterium ADurb.Bin168]
MSSPRRVLILQPIHEAGLTALRNAGLEIVHAPDATRETLLRLIPEADGLIVRTTQYRIDAEVMDASPRLKVIGRHGVGVDHIDLVAAEARGITVVNTPLANSQGVAEYTIGLMLSACRFIPRGNRAVREGRWAQREELIGDELFRHTLGIIGLGRVGTRVARIAVLGFQMRVLYFDIIRKHETEAALGVEFAPFEEVLRQADFLTLHTPLTEATRGMMNGGTLALMKQGAYLVNASRGEVVEIDALARSITSGRIAGAALDVFADEPFPADHPLLAMPEVIVSPHMASHSRDSMVRMALVAEDVARVLIGQEPLHPVGTGTVS